MKITEIRYTRLANLGDFNHEKLEIVATVEPNEDPDLVFKQARQFVMAHMRIAGFDAAREAIREDYEQEQGPVIDAGYPEIGEEYE